MNDTHRRLAWIRRLAIGCAIGMVFTIVLSAYMRLSQAGLGCEPWPACYAQAARDAAAGTSHPGSIGVGVGVAAARLAHRVVASVVLILVITLVLSTCFTRPRFTPAAALSATLLMLALGLAVLGVMTPGARLPAVVLGNLLGGFLMLALSVRLASWSTNPQAEADPSIGHWARASAALLTVQVALGALVSSTHAALSCDGWSACLASANHTGWDLRALNPWQVPSPSALLRTDPAAVALQAVHRTSALLTAACVAVLALQAWRRDRRADAVAVAAATAGVVSVGWLSAVHRLPIATVLLHNLLAAVLLAAVVRLIGKRRRRSGTDQSNRVLA